MGSTKNSILNMSGGTLTSTGDFNVGESAGGTLNQSGGTINAASGKIGNYYSQGNSALNWNLTGPGTVAITGNLRIGYNQGQSSGRAGNCTFTQSGVNSSVSVGGNLTIGTTDNNASAIGRSYVYNLSDGTLAVAGTVQFDPLGTRQFNFTGGTLSFGTWSSANSAPVLTNAGGTLSPGLAGVAKTSAIQTHYVQSSGTLAVDVGTGGTDLVNVTGNATLNGTLKVTALGTATPDTWYTVLTTTGTITDILTLDDPANWTKQVVGSNTLQVKAGGTPQTAILSTVSADPATVTVDNFSTITVTLKDSPSHVLSGKTVSLAKLSGLGTPTITTLNGTTDTNGIATFKVESTTPDVYIFQATDVTDSVTINQTATVTFTVGAAAKLAFTTQPGYGIPGSPLATQPKVTLQDAYGNTVTGTAQDVTVEIQNNAGPGGVLSGTKTVAVDTGTGVATFSGLSIDLIGTDYTLTATGSTVSTTAGVVVSSPFSVLAAKLAFTTQPGDGTPGGPLATQPKVTLQDADGNTLMGTAQDVTVEIQNNAGPGGVLSGTKTVAVNTGTGVATFSGLSIDLIGTGYTLTATGSTVSTTPGDVVSSSFSVLPRVGWWWTNQVTGAWSAASTWREGGGWPNTTGDYAGADRTCTVTYGSGDNHSITGFGWGHNGNDSTINPILTMTGGTLAVGGAGAFFTVGESAGATLNQSGGTINVGTISAPLNVEVGQYYTMGNQSQSWNLTGPGTVAITGNLRIGYSNGQSYRFNSPNYSADNTFTQSGANSSVSVASLTIGCGTGDQWAADHYTQAYTLSDGTLAVTGTVNFGIPGTPTDRRQFNFNGGTLSFGTWSSANSAPVLTNAGGTLSPGLAGVAKTSAIQTNYVQTSGTLSFDVGDAAKDLIEVTGDATLTGTLNLAELGTLTPDTWYTVLTTTGTITDSLTLADPANWAKQLIDSNKTLQVKKTSTALAGYAKWASEKGFTVGENDGPNQDPDGDGVKNIAEFAFNGDPLSGADNGRIYSLIADSDYTGPSGDGQKELILTVAVRSGTSTFITGETTSVATVTEGGITYTYTIEGSTTLGSFDTQVWPVNAVPLQNPVTPITIPSMPSAGTGYEYRSFSLVGSNGLPGKGFLRAKVESNP